MDVIVISIFFLCLVFLMIGAFSAQVARHSKRQQRLLAELLDEVRRLNGMIAATGPSQSFAKKTKTSTTEPVSSNITPGVERYPT